MSNLAATAAKGCRVLLVDALLDVFVAFFLENFPRLWVGIRLGVDVGNVKPFWMLVSSLFEGVCARVERLCPGVTNFTGPSKGLEFFAAFLEAFLEAFFGLPLLVEVFFGFRVPGGVRIGTGPFLDLRALGDCTTPA